MQIYDNISQLIGKTPLVKINRLNKTSNLVLGKVEYFNPTGSIKDRVALAMIEHAQKEGIIHPDRTVIIEPTSGNTGIGLALVCLIKGYKLILTMPETMSEERRKLLKAYNAKLVLTSGAKGMQGAVDEANRLKQEIKDSFIPQQFSNVANPAVHYNTTAQEIWNDTDNKVDIVVAGVGTGGTVSGIGKFLKEKNKDIKIVALEPKSSPLITEGNSGAHKIQGIGANFIPKNFNREYVDEVVTIEDELALEYTKKLSKEEGIFAGISSGAAIAAAIRLASEVENKTIVAVLPDSGMRYLSNLNFDD